jgi:hypothetical protein
MTKSIYDTAFYSEYQDDSIGSAREVLAIVNTLVSPKSVVDVGCGIGTWLKVWLDLGVENVKGIDGDYVDRKALLIPTEKFTAMDLTQPVNPGSSFDLVQSLEVAEHLPKESSERFVAFLCGLGPVVLFSAAIPYQGGTDHINEQWPEFWAELFRKQGYLTADAIRNEVWDDPKVAYYYAQNSFLFVKSEVVERLNPAIKPFVATSPKALSRVHPRRWQEAYEKPPKLEELAKVIPKSSVDFASRSFRKLTKVIK